MDFSFAVQVSLIVAASPRYSFGIVITNPFSVYSIFASLLMSLSSGAPDFSLSKVLLMVIESLSGSIAFGRLSSVTTTLSAILLLLVSPTLIV